MSEIVYTNSRTKYLIEGITKVAEECGFCVTITNSYTEGHYEALFSKFSPYGQDFYFYIDICDKDSWWSVHDKIDDYWDSFDVSSETYLWLDDEGHGVNGAPYEMIDVYNDMLACKNYIKELVDAIAQNS